MPWISESHLEEVLIHVMRCLPVLALVVSFFCLNKLGTKAQQRAQGKYFFHSTPSWWYDVYIISALWISDQCIHVLAAPGNKLPSEQVTEEDQEEKGGDEKKIEEENKNRDEESHGLSDVGSDSSRVEKDKEPSGVSAQRLPAWRTDFKDVWQRRIWTFLTVTFVNRT